MATGTLSPNPILTIWDVNGDPVSGAKIYVFAAGTSTPISTWTDSQLIGANQNSHPIVCNAAGQCVIYLAPGTSYKYVVTKADGTPLWTRDNISATGTTSVQSNNIGMACGRLTLTSNVAVTTDVVLTNTMLYYTPYAGNTIALFDGESWLVFTFSELSLATAAWTANKNSDIFMHADNGIPTLERQEWTDNTNRAVQIFKQDGVYVKAGNPTRRYLGTVRTGPSTGVLEDGFRKRLIWNYYNRVRRPVLATDTTDSWTYTSSAWRQANNNPLNQVEIVCGAAEDGIDLYVAGLGVGGTDPGVGIGLNTTTSVSLLSGITPGPSATNAYNRLTWTYVSEGYHFYAWIERGNAGMTFYGDGGQNVSFGVQFGIGGTWWC